MVLASQENLVYGIKLSSVGPARVTGSDVVHNPSGMDLAMKLHYLRGVYFFDSQAAQGMTTNRIKEAIFTWLCVSYRTCGRFRRSESSRPYLKCNDCGVRYLEAQCDKTLDEWLGLDCSLQKLLASNQIIGPELFFSPVVLFQVTYFKCGGISLGLSWSHVLGDAFAASDFINGLGQVMSGLEISKLPNYAKPNTNVQQKLAKNPSPPPLSIRHVDSVGDYWISPNNCKMETFSFPVTATHLNNLQVKILGPIQSDQIPNFELICALIWKCIATVREGPQPKLVTICKNDTNKRTEGECSNSQTISTVEADFRVSDMDPKELANLLAKQAGQNEKTRIEEAIENENGVADFVVYGANLTFVNWEDVNFYGLEVKGHKPVCVHYNIQGVGDEGAVLLLPAGAKELGDGGRVVTVILPEKEVFGVKSELRKNDLLFGNELE
ncbi:protein ECERIFERUM 26-like [Malus sylvestris]|uniref:protein ECERIFERUM 26-like n=1 Tax=Malus sylvestris TaxID=3752 RepID=UPI0021ACD962|nr:protein ECERIFERUM 26-like [Malus sylvestris]